MAPVPDPGFQAQDPDPRGVSIARLISSEFGTSEMVVWQQLSHRDTRIELDGVPWEGDRQFIPRARLLGKKVDVLAPERQWRFTYTETE